MSSLRVISKSVPNFSKAVISSTTKVGYRSITISASQDANILSTSRTSMSNTQSSKFTPMQLTCNFQTSPKQAKSNEIVFPEISERSSNQTIITHLMFSNNTKQTFASAPKQTISTSDAFATHVTSASGVVNILKPELS